jgi:hypothetical protein
MVDPLAVPVSLSGLRRNKMDHRLAVEVEPISRKVEGRAVARLEIQQFFEEGPRPFKIGGAESDVI